MQLLKSIIPGTFTGRIGILLWLALVFVGCNQQPAPTATVSEPTEGATAVAVEPDDPETRVLPTVYPTPSPFPTPEPTDPLPTSAPRPTATPVDFSELVVEVHYSVPALGLERSLRGNVSSHLELTDETTGESATITDSPGIMFELQQTLPTATLSELPDGCDLCVRLSYELFLAGESGEGWLEDPVLLASFENFFSARLGPHFPPNAIVGLRRSATPYNVAHTVALTSNGSLWRWTATEGELNGPEASDGTLAALAGEIDLTSVNTDYQGPCPQGSGVETLYLANGDEEALVDVVCPELALPLSLLPLYLQLDALADEKTADEALPQPDPTVPLESVVYYQRQDGSKLILLYDGRARAISGEGATASAVLAEDQATNTAVSLAESGNLQLGVSTLDFENADNILIARGPDGVYEVTWGALPPENLTQIIEELDSLLADMLEDAEPPDDGTPTATPDPDATPGTETPTPTPSDEETPES